MQMTDDIRKQLIDAARAAVSKAFLTSLGGTAYGAAVITSSGKIYTAGQYSSWNHVTNVHAEQASLVLATMSDDPDVMALAVASTSPEDLTTPCGCCRQVLSEHAMRTGRDFEILLAHRFDSGFDITNVSTLLPMTWLPRSKIISQAISCERHGTLLPSEPLNNNLLDTGDHLLLKDGSLAMVWDSRFISKKSLIKIKYEKLNGNSWNKIPHSFTDSAKYHKWLVDKNWDIETPIGLKAAIAGAQDITGVIPARNINETDHLPENILQILNKSGIIKEKIKISGSRSTGLFQTSSDWDLVLSVDTETLVKFRKNLFNALKNNLISLPEQSGTWKLLDRYFPGGKKTIIEQKRFIDTVQEKDVVVTFIFIPTESLEPIWNEEWKSHGRTAFHGQIIEASQAAFKRSITKMELITGEEIEVISYHKAANLLQKGDQISLRGWLLEKNGKKRLIQNSIETDGISWFLGGKQ